MEALDIFGEYTMWLRANVPLAYENLAPPATESGIAAIEEAIGYRLPTEVRAVLGMHNGQRSSGDDGGVPCIPTLDFLSTEAIYGRWKSWARIRQGPDIDALQRMGGVRRGAEGIVKPLYTSPGWIPLWSDPMRPDYIGLDLDPDTGGTLGQIINFGRNEEIHFVCARDFTGLLKILLEEVRSGVWRASELSDESDEDEDFVDEEWFDDPDPVPWFGEPGQHFFNALYQWFENAGDFTNQ